MARMTCALAIFAESSLRNNRIVSALSELSPLCNDLYQRSEPLAGYTSLVKIPEPAWSGIITIVFAAGRLQLTYLSDTVSFLSEKSMRSLRRVSKSISASRSHRRRRLLPHIAPHLLPHARNRPLRRRCTRPTLVCRNPHNSPRRPPSPQNRSSFPHSTPCAGHSPATS